MNFEISLGMIAGGAYIGSLSTDHDMTAVAAFPNLDLALGKDLSGFNVLKQSAVTLLVVLLDGGDKTELGSQLGEAFLLGGLSEAGVHVGPLVVFAFSGVQQVFGGIADALELLAPHLGVFLLN